MATHVFVLFMMLVWLGWVWFRLNVVMVGVGQAAAHLIYIGKHNQERLCGCCVAWAWVVVCVVNTVVMIMVHGAASPQRNVNTLLQNV